jgi:hypothetical protein
MIVRRDTSDYYYLPTGYRIERNSGLLVLVRPDGSVMDTFGGHRAIGEIVERYAWEDSSAQEEEEEEEEEEECKGGRLPGGCSAYEERLLELPVATVVGLLWLAGVIPIGLCAVALYSLWLVLRTLAGG